MHFSGRTTFRVDSARLWEELWKPEQIASLLPGCEEVRVVAPLSRYQARVAERVGPFRVAFDVDVTVTEAEPPSAARGVVSGQESKLASSLRGEFVLLLRPSAADGTELLFEVEVSLRGRLGSLAGNALRRKFDEMFGRFETRLAEILIPVEGAPSRIPDGARSGRGPN